MMMLFYYLQNAVCPNTDPYTPLLPHYTAAIKNYAPKPPAFKLSGLTLNIEPKYPGIQCCASEQLISLFF